MTWCLSEPVFNLRKRRFVPATGLEIVRNALREVHHDSKHGSVFRRTDRNRIHCTSLGHDDLLVQPEAPQPGVHELHEPSRKRSYLPCRNDHRKKRRRADKQKQRQSIYNHSFDIPLAEGSVGLRWFDFRHWQRRMQFPGRPQDYHHIVLSDRSSRRADMATYLKLS